MAMFVHQPQAMPVARAMRQKEPMTALLRPSAYGSHTKGYVMKLRMTGFECLLLFVIRLCREGNTSTSAGVGPAIDETACLGISRIIDEFPNHLMWCSFSSLAFIVNAKLRIMVRTAKFSAVKPRKIIDSRRLFRGGPWRCGRRRGLCRGLRGGCRCCRACRRIRGGRWRQRPRHLCSR